MGNKLTSLEEFDVQRTLQTPHLLFSRKLAYADKKVAFIVLRKKEDEMLLINSSGFSNAAIFAGLTEKHIEYFAKNAPMEYKNEIMKILRDKAAMEGVREIAEDMDEDEGDGLTKHQDRIKKVIRYILDNQIAFQN